VIALDEERPLGVVAWTLASGTATKTTTKTPAA
jgi:hypothetical protein